MSLRPERILAEIDRQLKAARRTVSELTAARNHYASAYGLLRRGSVPTVEDDEVDEDSDDGEVKSSPDPPRDGST